MTATMRARTRALALSTATIGVLVGAGSAHAQQLTPYAASDLIVSSSTYYDPNFGVGTILPLVSATTGLSTNTAATVGSAFCGNSTCTQNVWNNSLKATAGYIGSGAKDGNFGTTSAIFLSAINTSTGAVDATVNVTAAAAAQGINAATSFASKSELAINWTPDGSSLTFMAYNTTANGQLDISNSNSFAGSEPGNTDGAPATQRGVYQFNLATNTVQQTLSGAYTGNNGRAAILTANGYYTVGNAGNGNGSTTATNGNGVQLVTPGTNTTNVNAIGAFTIAQAGYSQGSDKPSKDSNYRGETIYNNTLYVTKGSGSNGINTVYQVGTAGSLPTAGSGNTGTTSTPVSILPGFSTTLANATPSQSSPVYHPFGLFFANSTTLYVADEGSGSTTDFTTQPYEAGGLQKWVLNTATNTWQLAYTLKGSLIGASYTVNGTGSLSGDSTSVTTDGLRNLAGRVNSDGTVTLYAVTSTTGSALGDSGADPNKVVAITDTLSATSASQVVGEDYTTLETAALGQVLRGVAIAPSTVPVPGAAWLLGSGVLGLVGIARRRRSA